MEQRLVGGMDLNKREMDQQRRREGRWCCVELFVNMKSKSIVRDPGGSNSCAGEFECFESSQTYPWPYEVRDALPERRRGTPARPARAPRRPAHAPHPLRAPSLPPGPRAPTRRPSTEGRHAGTLAPSPSAGEGPSPAPPARRAALPAGRAVSARRRPRASSISPQSASP